jgi:hypothetical protein
LLQEYTAQNAEKENLERKMRQEQLERIKRKREEIEAQQRKKVSRSMSKKKRKTVDSADSDFTASSSSSEEEFNFDFDRKPKTTVNDRSPITVFSSDQNEPGSPRNSEPILLSEDEDNDRIDAMNVRIAEPKTGKSPYMSNLVVLDESCESESENDDFDFEKVPTPKTTVKQVTSTPQESCPAAETSSTTSPVISPTPIPRLALKENWNCSRCTLENLQSLDICEGCGLRFRRSRLQTPVLDWDD